MLLRRKDPPPWPCCLCGGRIEEAPDLTFLRVFPGRTHAACVDFWSHRKCIDEALQPSFAPDLDREEAYGGWEREDRGMALQPEPLPCCLCGAGIEPGDRIGLHVRPAHMDDYVTFWMHRKCVRKAMHWRSWLLELRWSGIYGT